jgi:hypothetical protein
MANKKRRRTRNRRFVWGGRWLPESQSVQFTVPFAGATLPTTHAAHDTVALSFAANPALHCRHSKALAAAYRPASHWPQLDMLLCGVKWPAAWLEAKRYMFKKIKTEGIARIIGSLLIGSLLNVSGWPSFNVSLWLYFIMIVYQALS